MLLLSGCAPLPPPPERPVPPLRIRRAPQKVGPEIRIGILSGMESVEFSADRDFVVSKTNGLVLASGTNRDRWKIQIRKARPAKMLYRLVAASMSSMENARDQAQEIEAKGLGTAIESFPVNPDSQLPGADTLYRIYLKPVFETYEDAKAFQNSIEDRVETFLSPLVHERVEGSVELQNTGTGEKWAVAESVRIRGANITVYAVPVGEGYHWEHSEDLTYPQTVEFNIGPEGKIAVVNVLPLETYLQGVVPSEMHPGFPLEALKAQAVAARSRVYNRIGENGHGADSFDFCDEVHCQVYSGLSRRTPMTDLAVEETAGQVLWYRSGVCDAVFGGMCGGHGEDAQAAWGSQVDYLEGNWDGTGLRRYGRLNGEKDVRKWIDGSPPCWCNTTQKNSPTFFEYTRKYFRWQIGIGRSELTANLVQAGYARIGSIRELIPEQRGLSGRIIRLRIVGSDGETIIRGELNIRKALSPQTLWSSCFYVEKESGSFVLKGAGWGHGVGMCQTGAGQMAWKGKRYDAILRQYYRGAHIRKLY